MEKLIRLVLKLRAGGSPNDQELKMAHTPLYRLFGFRSSEECIKFFNRKI